MIIMILSRVLLNRLNLIITTMHQFSIFGEQLVYISHHSQPASIPSLDSQSVQTVAMSLLLVVVLLFFSSSCSVSSGQYYVSDDCSSVTQSPCNPLSVYAGDMSQYSNTIFYFIGTSVINFNVTMDSIQNITLQGLDQSPTINCSHTCRLIKIKSSNHVSFSNLSFQQCDIDFRYSSNITISSSIFKNLKLINVFDSKITSSVIDAVSQSLRITYFPPKVCYNELNHYSLKLENVTVTRSALKLQSYLILQMAHGTSYNLSVIFDNVDIIRHGVHHVFRQSLFSLYITNSSLSKSGAGFSLIFRKNLKSKCNIKGVQPQSSIAFEKCKFHNNYYGLRLVGDYFKFNIPRSITITCKSCSIRDNHFYGLWINGHLLTSTQINVIDTELVRNRQNLIAACSSVLLNNITVTNSLSTGLVIMSSVVTVENRLVFKNNTGVVGGGMAINSSSVVALSPSANLEFIDNHATYKGGGIYLDEKNGCELIGECDSVSLIPLTFKHNTAGVAGNDIYGQISGFNKLFNSTKNASTSSDANVFAFCDPNSKRITPQHNHEIQYVFPGQALKYNVAFFGLSCNNSYSLTDGSNTRNERDTDK